MLRSIGFSLVPAPNGSTQRANIRWGKWILTLSKYLSEHNGKIPRPNTKNPERKKLRFWVLEQQRKIKNGELLGERAMEFMEAFVNNNQYKNNSKQNNNKKALGKEESSHQSPSIKGQCTNSDDDESSRRSEVVGDDIEEALADPWERNFKALSEHFKSKGPNAPVRKKDKELQIW